MKEKSRYFVSSIFLAYAKYVMSLSNMASNHLLDFHRTPSGGNRVLLSRTPKSCSVYLCVPIFSII